jgi:hypothetical protein
MLRRHGEIGRPPFAILCVAAPHQIAFGGAICDPSVDRKNKLRQKAA